MAGVYTACAVKKWFKPTPRSWARWRGSCFRPQPSYIPHNVEKEDFAVLGRFEEAVLMALINAKGEVTTAEVYEGLADKLKRVSFGAIYTTLDRMVDKKFVAVRKGKPLPERGGKARNYYRVTSGGRAAVIEAQRTTSALALPSLVGNAAAS
jgi:PadR family transcriptional regulator PadR